MKEVPHNVIVYYLCGALSFVAKKYERDHASLPFENPLTGQEANKFMRNDEYESHWHVAQLDIVNS